MWKTSGKIKRIVNNIKLKKKMTFVWLFSVMIILAFALWGDYKIIRSYNDTLYSVMVDSMNYALSGISQRLDDYETLSEAIFRSSLIQEKLTRVLKNQKLYYADYESIRKLIATESNQYDYINYAILIDETTGSEIGDTASIGLTAEKKERILEAAEEGQGRPVWITEYGKDSQMILTRKINRIENLGKDTLATLIINIDIAALIRDTGISKQKNFWCVLVDSEGNSLSDSRELTNTQVQDIYEQIRGEKFAVVVANGYQYFAVYREESFEKWGYIYFSDYEEIYSRVNSNVKRIALVGILCVLLIVILNSFFTRDILRGFGRLIQKFQAFSEDITKQDSLEDAQRKDEIGILYQQFGLMQEKVVQLIQENYIMELERKRAQVEMLETQINPHFLYNTLQTIDWRAKALHSEEISKMVESLSRILQITLSNRKSCLTVEEELDLVQQFVTIQQMRMEGELLYEARVEPELWMAKIPKLVIQPLVENGISHSMNAMLKVARILVEVKREGEDLAVLVKNNGSRFPEDLLRKLNQREIQPAGHGIGILNIDTRIKLTYGEDYGISFCNEEEYAVAKLRIPFEAEGISDV
ncbi:MAG: histidine kinase [Candidatus Limivivens sp.]|nr:histidine kinase [Candidatus Limivivens sp.]